MQAILETSKRNPYSPPLVGVEEGHRLEAEQLRYDQVGEGLDARRVLLHCAVVEAARVLQVVLDLDQLVRKLAEIRVGLELRVALLQEQQLLQALAERALVAEALGERSGAGGARAQLGHAREQRLFVGGVAAHGLDQQRHQVGAALELHVDVGEALARLVALGDQAVVDPGHGNEEQRKRRDEDRKSTRLN